MDRMTAERRAEIVKMWIDHGYSYRPTGDTVRALLDELEAVEAELKDARFHWDDDINCLNKISLENEALRKERDQWKNRHDSVLSTWEMRDSEFLTKHQAEFHDLRKELIESQATNEERNQRLSKAETLVLKYKADVEHLGKQYEDALDATIKAQSFNRTFAAQRDEMRALVAKLVGALEKECKCIPDSRYPANRICAAHLDLAETAEQRRSLGL